MNGSSSTTSSSVGNTVTTARSFGSKGILVKARRCYSVASSMSFVRPRNWQILKLRASYRFFFCQATVPELSNAYAVLRGLIYMLVDTQPSLLPHVQKRFKATGEPRFREAEAWTILCNMFSDILCESSLDTIYVVVDALDECVQDQDKLLQFILKETKDFPRVKWIIYSRNHVQQRERLVESQLILCLELQDNAEYVSRAIEAYICDRISTLESLQDNPDREYVRQALQKKAEGTFLWVALVIQELQDVDSWDVRQVVDEVPKGLDDLYARMINHINKLAGQSRDYCQLVLSAATLAYRPLQLPELGVVSELPDKIAGNAKNIETIVKRSGSFLTVRDKTVYFVHQTARDFLIEKGGQSIFSAGPAVAQRRIFTQSLQVMRKTLRRDMYSLGALGTPIKQAQPPTPDPLAVSRYSCVYWVDHLQESGAYEDLKDSGTVDMFLRTQCLYWLEALSLLRSISDGIMSIQKLKHLVSEQPTAAKLSTLVQDTYRFILYHRGAIENNPLQAYGCGLVFSPSRCMIKQLFQHEQLTGLVMMPSMGDDWDAQTGACLQTLEGHSNSVTSVVFSPDSSHIVSGSLDHIIKIWDAQTGSCLQTLKGHRNIVRSVGFSYNNSRIVSGSDDKTIKIWDAYTGVCLQTLKGHSNEVESVGFSHNGSHIASGSSDHTIKIWDTQTGVCLQTLKGHDGDVSSVVFSYNSSHIASGSNDYTIKVWDAQTDVCLQTLEGHNNLVRVVGFSYNSSHFISGSNDHTIKIWDAQTGVCLQTLIGHTDHVYSVEFSYDGNYIVSGSDDRTIKIWNTYTGACLRTLERYDLLVILVRLSHNNSHVASPSADNMIRIWDAHTGACLQTLKGHTDVVTSVAFSHDSSRVASGSWDNTVKVWDIQTGVCLQTLEGHKRLVNAVGFSRSRVASGSYDNTIKIWDAQTGACLQTLSVTRIVRSLSFDASGFSLYTDIGIVVLRDSPRSVPTTSTEAVPAELQSFPPTQYSPTPEYQGYGISSDGRWITRRSKNWLWLPPTYRPNCSALGRSGLSLAFGCRSGRVLIFEFAPEDSN